MQKDERRTETKTRKPLRVKTAQLIGQVHSMSGKSWWNMHTLEEDKGYSMTVEPDGGLYVEHELDPDMAYRIPSSAWHGEVYKRARPGRPAKEDSE